MKISLIKLMCLLLLAGSIATGCEQRYYIGRGHHDNGLHLGDRHNHEKHNKYKQYNKHNKHNDRD